MRTSLFTLLAFFLLSTTFLSTVAYGQQDQSASDNKNSSQSVEGSVVSSSRQTLVVRTDDNQYQLFTYAPNANHPNTLAAGTRVRVTAEPPDEDGTRDATSVTVVEGGSAATATDKGAQAAPVPQKIRGMESDIRRESRRWRLGVRGGAAFDPELFTFGVQSQMGPIFHPRVLFRPNAEFAFGEVTDLISLNLEAIYRFSDRARRRAWTPYVGLGPALIFIHQNFEKGREIDFGNFDYETGFNVLAGLQSRRGPFVELKSSLYSGPAPKLRLIVGYTF